MATRGGSGVGVIGRKKAVIVAVAIALDLAQTQPA
jgi:hypothetical protein